MHFHLEKANQDFPQASNLSRGLEIFLSPYRQLFRSLGKQASSNDRELLSEFEKFERSGLRMTCPGFPDYPVRFLEMPSPPELLFYLGSPIWTHKKLLAVVGSREPSVLSLRWLDEHLPAALQEQSWIGLSGGARGVDQVCHCTSLRLQLPTVAVLPSGLQQMYPAQLQNLSQAILESGGVFISEYPPQHPMMKHQFNRRNELIAALSFAVLIIDAKRKSGTLLTARHAVEMSRPLFVLPSHPMDFQSHGSLDLLCEGATPVRDAQELCMYLESELLGLP